VPWSYEVGARTTFLVSTLQLSKLGPPFLDLKAGGRALPHSSSLFFVWRRGEHVRYGIETLVGNSYSTSTTSILFQAAGVTAEYHTSGRLFLALGVQGGAVLASATQPTGAAADGSDVRAGFHYKGSGLFVAPSLGIGLRLRKYDLAMIAKQTVHVPGTDGLEGFNALYTGVSFGRRF
jgi:hypothetical protein